MAYDVQLLPRVEKELSKLSRHLQIRITHAIHALSDDPRPSGCKKLAGDDNLWRIRVGNYRVLYEIHDARLLILVLRVSDRQDVYRK